MTATGAERGNLPAADSPPAAFAPDDATALAPPEDASPGDALPTVAPRERRRAARAALGGALALGALADVLFRDVPLGLNLAAWTAAALAAVTLLARRLGRPVTVGAGLLGALALAFAACVAWRDAGALVALDVAALATVAAALGRALRYGTAWAVEHADAGAYAAGAAAVAREVVAGAAPLARGDAAVAELRHAHRAAGVRTAVRGVLFAAPVLLLFGLLLTSADAAFGNLVARALALDVGALADHLAWTGVVAWGAAGFAAGALFAPAPAGGRVGRGAARGWFGRATPAEVCVALGLVDALLAAFVVVQLGWLFGGRAVVGGGAGVTYAEYARRGFFELAAVAGLALPLLVATRTAVVRAGARGAAGRRAMPAYRVAAGALIALVVVLLASAADRMRLYQAAYGVTELRLYVSAFMAWLLAVFAWAAATLLRERPAPFALGGLLLGWTWVLGLNVADPAAWTVRVNAGRDTAAHPLDVEYLAELGADAVPGLVAQVWPRLSPGGRTDYGREARCVVARRVALARDADAGGWRAWNVARRRAAAAARAALGAATAAPRECPFGATTDGG